jgi:hypothetical protein
MKTQRPEPKHTTNRLYKYDRAMLEAMKRSAHHPRPISMVSNVPEFAKLGSNK